MKLVETRYKTDEMLESMIELSRSKYYQNVEHLSFECLVEYIMVGFSFGRQAGHTTAIINLLNKSDERYLVVVPNYSMRIEIVRNAELSKHKYIITMETQLNYFRGKTDLFDEYGVIFDSCGNESKIRQFIYSRLEFPHPKSIVCVN